MCLLDKLWLGSKPKQTGSVLSCPSGSPRLGRCKDAYTALGNMPNSLDGFRNYVLNGQENDSEGDSVARKPWKSYRSSRPSSTERTSLRDTAWVLGSQDMDS